MSQPSPTARRQLERIHGARRCIHDWDPHTHQHCGRPAVIHVLQTSGRWTMSCQYHAKTWIGQRVRDFHHIGGDCGLPDTTWVLSNQDGRGRCFIEDLDLPDLFATDAELRGETR